MTTIDPLAVRALDELGAELQGAPHEVATTTVKAMTKTMRNGSLGITRLTKGMPLEHQCQGDSCDIPARWHTQASGTQPPLRRLRLELASPRYVALGGFQKPRVLSLPRCVRFAGPVSDPVRSVSLS
jgi:hypothetical protein